MNCGAFLAVGIELKPLDLNSNAADDAQLEEKFIAEDLFNAVREIHAAILEDCEHPDGCST